LVNWLKLVGWDFVLLYVKNVEKKLERLKKHSVKHIHDYPAKRSLVKNVPKLSKLKNR